MVKLCERKRKNIDAELDLNGSQLALAGSCTFEQRLSRDILIYLYYLVTLNESCIQRFCSTPPIQNWCASRLLARANCKLFFLNKSNQFTFFNSHLESSCIIAYCLLSAVLFIFFRSASVDNRGLFPGMSNYFIWHRIWVRLGGWLCLRRPWARVLVRRAK